MKPKLIICYGIPASGKTTWSKDQVLKGQGSVVRVNKDDLRAMINCSQWSKQREKLIVETRDAIIRVYIKAGVSVIVDDTNIEGNHIDHLIGLAKELEVNAMLKFFLIDLDEAIARDSKRPVPVGATVIRRMYKALNLERIKV